MTEKEKFYEERCQQILPPVQRGWKDVWEFLTLPAYSLSDYLYLGQLKKCYSDMENPFSDENMNKMADSWVKAVMENKKMSVDFLASVGDSWLTVMAQKKIDQYYPELSEEFHQRMEEVLDDVSEVRHLRDIRYCQSYFRKKPKKIAMFTGKEMYHILKNLPCRQSKKLIFLYLQNYGKEKED